MKKSWTTSLPPLLLRNRCLFHWFKAQGTGPTDKGAAGTDRPHAVRATVPDLPPAIGAAREAIHAPGPVDRVGVAAGNFKTDPLPAGYDVALLANLLSVSSEATNRALLRRIYQQLPEGGAIILCGWILDDARTSPTIPVLFCLQDINWRAPDVERSGLTYCSWLRDAGFVEVEHRTLCPPTSFVVGRRRDR